MAASPNDAFADIVNLLAAPLASGIRAADQLRHGVDELIRAVENVNRTMENLNETAARVNALLAEVEQPVRAMIPQLTRAVERADAISRVLDPAKVSEVVTGLGDLTKRLAPLAGLAENAGGLLGLAGGLRIPGFGGKPADPIPPAGTAKAAKAAAAEAADTSTPPPAERKPAAAPTTKAPAKQAPAKQAQRSSTAGTRAPAASPTRKGHHASTRSTER